MIQVLIIEDDPMVRDINTKFMGKVSDFCLLKAVSSIAEAKALIAVEDSNPDLILLDIFLPRENGLDFLKWLRKEEINVDVILITADKSSEAVQEAFRYGAVDYLIKPFTFERFKESLLQYKSRFDGLKYIDSIEQSELDSFITINRFSDVKDTESQLDLGKGFNHHTYHKISIGIEKYGKEPFSADVLAEELGMARVTARRYLEYMEKEGKVFITIEYGKIGRPQHQYKLR